MLCIRTFLPDISMELLSFLLLAAGRFVAALVIPQETSTVGTVVARNPSNNLKIDTSTYSGPTEITLARNEKRVINYKEEGGENRCIFAKVKVQSAIGHASWQISEERDSSEHDCKTYCAIHSMKTQDDIRSASCFKNDGKPCVSEKGDYEVQPTLQEVDKTPLGTVIYGVGKCVCDWALLDDFVEDFVTKALAAVGEVSCRRKRSIRKGRHAAL
jgi:hypothetical protein